MSDDVTPFEQEVRKHQEAFMLGDPRAQSWVFENVLPVLERRARKKYKLPEDVAHDAAIDALLYVRSRGVKELGTGYSLMALLNKALEWHVLKAKRDYALYAGDFPVPVGTELGLDMEGTDEGDVPDPEPLVFIEASMMATGYAPHSWLTSINLTTPEDEVMTENLMHRMERVATDMCGRDAWGTYYSNVVLGESQEALAEKLDVSQATVSRMISQVQAALKADLGIK